MSGESCRGTDTLDEPQAGRFRRLIDEAPDAIMILRPDLAIRYANRATGIALGRDLREIVGAPFSEYLHPAGIEWSPHWTSRVPAELRLQHADGSYRLFEIKRAELFEDPSDEELAIFLRDVTEERALKDQLTHRSLHDVLTGLPNRTLFVDRLEHALARATRIGEPVIVLFADVDDFKTVNDRFGHEVGDMLLTAIGRRLQSCLRPGDTVARFGGDEFAVLLEHTTGPRGAVKAMERIARASRDPVVLGGRTFFVTISIGSAVSGPQRNSAEDLVRRADAAMYRAKGYGKGRFAVSDVEARDPKQGTSTFEEDLTEALERKELKVYYQPEVALTSGEIVGMEALLRWRYPRYDPLPVPEIVALASANGVLETIEYWVLEEACRQASAWQDSFLDKPSSVSVNLSAEQLRGPALADKISAVLRETDLDPGNLTLETEGLTATGAPQVAAALEGLENLGVGLAVPGFGRESLSLSYLERFAVDRLKIDRRLIGKLGRGDENGAKLVSAMVGFARAMDIRAVAVGVESAGQMERLRGMACDLGQGYYFWKPMPNEAATALLGNTSAAR